VNRIRQLPKFSNFLRPTPFPTLRGAVTKGKVIIINASQLRVDTLVVDNVGPIQHIPLPDINFETISDLSKRIQNRPQLTASEKERNYYVGRHLRPALRRIWTDIICPIFQKLDIPLNEYDQLPQRRIWWYPTGPLTFIPIHAAGDNSVDVTRLVISSYVTTLSSLLQAQTQTHYQTAQPKLLGVSQPNTPGQSPLPHSSEE
jgi:hypothetical protein